MDDQARTPDHEHDPAEGEVSEVQTLEGAEEPISDDQSVAGQPAGESGEVDEGPTGPNARAGSNRT